MRRFALLVGADDGGPEREALRYSSTDADAVAQTLQRLGGVRSSDLTQLRDPTPTQLREAFGSITAAAKSAHNGGQTVHFVFYYSGHSDERALLMGGLRLEYRELKRLVDAVTADVHIAILDSCASGAFTRLKGGHKRPPFLVGDASDVAGHAYLTSAAADENAQESDSIGGSYFTHFLISGMRGGADIDGDDMVTLDEAYRFAYDQTLRRTESTRAGAQHAAYDIDLSGSGDLVMTDLRRATAKLAIGAGVGGRIFVRDASGTLHAELEKVPGAPSIVLALPAGEYRVTLDDGRRYSAATLTLDDGGNETLTTSSFLPVGREAASQKGDAGTHEDSSTELFYQPVELSLVPPVSLSERRAPYQKNSLAFGLLWTQNAELDGVMMTMGINHTSIRAHGAQMSMVANVTLGQMQGLQMSQGYNRAGQLRGAQMGLVNSAGGALRREGHPEEEPPPDPETAGEYYSGGLQLGLLNLSRGSFDGLQLGLINISDDAAAQLGLFSYDRRGGIHPHLSTSELSAVQVGLRFSARKTYTFITYGVHPLSPGDSWNLRLGLGGRVRFGQRKRGFVDMDVAGGAAFYSLNRIEMPAGFIRARVMVGYQPYRHLSVYGGLTGTLLLDAPGHNRSSARPGLQYLTTQVDGSDVLVRGWPGFVFGMGF